MRRILVTGDRNWSCDDVAREVLERMEDRYGADGFVIVHGDAPGVDATFRDACEALGYRHEPHPARWDDLDAPGARILTRKDGTTYNAAAGPLRNQEMVDSGADFAIAVHKNLGWSKGTRDCVERCLRAGVPVYLIASDKVDPLRVVVGFKNKEVVTRFTRRKEA